MHHRHWFMDISCAVAAGALCDYVQVWEMVDAVVLQPACRSFFIGMSNMPGARAPWSCSSGLRFRNGCERAPEGNYITSRNRICAPWVENVDHSLMNRLLAREAWDRVLAPLGLRALLQALNSKNPSLVVALPNIPFYTGALERTRYSDSPGLLDPVEERNQRVFRGGTRPRHLCIVR